MMIILSSGFTVILPTVPHLAAGSQAEFGDKIKRGRHFVARDSPAAKSEEFFPDGAGMPVTQLDLGVDSFSQLRVRTAAYARTSHRRVLVEHSGDFLRKNFMTCYVDHGGGPPVQHDSTTLV